MNSTRIRMISFSKPHDHPSAVPGGRLAAIVAAALLSAGTAVAQSPATPAKPIVINAAVSNIDDATNTANFTQISVAQGTTRLSAQRARATGLGFQNSQWTFSGRVVLNLEPDATLWADQAVLEYRDGELVQVKASGAQTHFEQLRANSQQPRHGQADEIIYDPKQATVHLQGHAHLSDGHGTEVNAPTLIYSIRDVSLQSDSGTKGSALH